MEIGKLSNYTGQVKEALSTYLSQIDKDIKKLYTLINGKVSFGDGTDGDRDNISGEFQVIADTGAAETEFAVPHSLASTPIGFTVMKRDKPSQIYDSGTAWTSSNAYFKCTSASAAITLFLDSN